MKKFIILSSLILLCLDAFAGNKTRTCHPDSTVMFAHRDTCDLYMDIYQPAAGSDCAGKPTVIFVFGGGFIMGSRNSIHYDSWFKDMTSRGYRIVSIDYRLGLKGVKKIGMAQANLVMNAVSMAVEDAFSATSWLCEHASDFGIDTGNIVISGSSAGAITSLQCEYEICNRSSLAAVLPEGFNYAGVMSFSGAITNMGLPFTYGSEPCPMLLLHGTADMIVDYNKVGIFNKGLFGPVKIVKLLDKLGYDKYWVIRYKDKMHEIASSMPYTVDIQEAFMKHCIIERKACKVDALVDDPSIKTNKAFADLKDLYSK